MKQLTKLLACDLHGYSCKHIMYYHPKDIIYVISYIADTIITRFILRKDKMTEEYKKDLTSTFKYIASKNGVKFDIDELIDDIKLYSLYKLRIEYIQYIKSCKNVKKEIKKYYKIKEYAKQLFGKKEWYGFARDEFRHTFNKLIDNTQNKYYYFFRENPKMLNIKIYNIPNQLIFNKKNRHNK